MVISLDLKFTTRITSSETSSQKLGYMSPVDVENESALKNVTFVATSAGSLVGWIHTRTKVIFICALLGRCVVFYYE